MPKRLNLLPNTHMEGTRLTFICDVPETNPRRCVFLCDCGAEIESPLGDVRHLNTRSCGCLRKEVTTYKNTKHSHAVRNEQSGAYRSWQAMHQRAGKVKNYEHVSVCSRWSGDDGFANFYTDMGERPAGLTIERLDGTKDYEPNNCVWATYSEQAQNTRNTVIVEINGEHKSINEWCRVYGIGYHVVKQRRQRGISLIDAITTPIDLKKSHMRK